MGKDQSIYQLDLKNVAGVPVIEIAGVMSKATLEELEKLISRLASAGHFHIVLNVKRALAPNLAMLESLAESVKRIRSHYGTVDLVAEASQIAQLSVGGTLAKLFRFCISEGQAFQRIKGLLRPEETFAGATARLQETK